MYIGYLVGNDFLPNLPSMDIGEGGLDTLYGAYKELLPKLGGYLCQWGTIHMSRLEAMFVFLSKIEAKVFETRADENEKREQREAKYGRYGGGGKTANSNNSNKKGNNNNKPEWASESLESKDEGDFQLTKKKLSKPLAKLAQSAKGKKLGLSADDLEGADDDDDDDVGDELSQTASTPDSSVLHSPPPLPSPEGGTSNEFALYLLITIPYHYYM